MLLRSLCAPLDLAQQPGSYRRPLKDQGVGPASSSPPSYEEVMAKSQREASSYIAEQPIPPRVSLDMTRVDPILAAAYKNQTESPLLRLKDALLIKVMSHLQHTDILCLRMVSRDFMRLYSHPNAGQSKHLMGSKCGIWAEPRVPPMRFSRLCTRCLEWRRRRHYTTDREVLEDVPFLFCAGCKMEHRAFYFSPQQRHKANDNDRICKGREQYLTVCQHMSFTWDSLETRARKLWKGSDGHHLCCRDQGHSRSREHGLGFNPWRMCGSDAPCLQVGHSEEGEVWIDLWAGLHFECKPTAPSGQVSSVAFRNALRDRVKKERPQGSFSWSALAAKPDSDFALMPFDPNICDCLDWGLNALPQPDPAVHLPGIRGFEWKLCPNPQRPWRELSVLRRETRFYDADEIYHGRCGHGACREGPGNRCAGFYHEIINSKRRSEDSFSRPALAFTKCKKKEGFMKVREHLSFGVRSPTDQFWMQIIGATDPKTWAHDKEMHHIMYCPEESCAINQRSMITKFQEGENKLIHHF